MLRALVWALCCSLAVADGLLACSTGCEKENADPHEYAAGRTSQSCASYETGGFDEPYVPFGAGRRLRLVHGLGQTPDDLQSYVAFVREPLPQGENGNTAESAGNQVIIEAVNDEYVQVRNDTCETFFLRLVARVSVPAPSCVAASPDPGTGGAAGAGG